MSRITAPYPPFPPCTPARHAASTALRGLLCIGVALAGLLLDPPAAQAAEKRIALVVGNARYPVAPLNNPENDARVVASTLRRLGFEVSEHVNLPVKTFRQVLREYARRLQNEEGASVFYYAGHGVQIDGRNYLLPVDINIRDEDEIRDEAVDVDELFISRLERARTQVRIVILDACRDNPFATGGRGLAKNPSRGLRAVGGGLAEMAARGALIAYSSAPGATAEDGPPGSNSVYTRNLVQEMLAEGVEVEQMFKNVRVKVLRETEQRQIPWVNTSLIADFSFNPRPGAAGPTGQEAGRREELERLQAALAQREREQKRLEAELRALREQGPAGTPAAAAAIPGRPGNAPAAPPPAAVTSASPAVTSASPAVTSAPTATSPATPRPEAAAPARPATTTAGRAGNKSTAGAASERCVALQIRAQLSEITPAELALMQRECR